MNINFLYFYFDLLFIYCLLVIFRNVVKIMLEILKQDRIKLYLPSKLSLF